MTRTDAYLPRTQWKKGMYVGRLLLIGPDAAAYRVSSRSFPNRKIVGRNGALTVIPTADAEATENPYVSYNCVRVVESEGDEATTMVAIGNGTHVDAVAEKLGLGYPARDALALSLLAYDFEKDDYDTPRIAGVLGPESFVGIVRRDAIVVERVEEPTLVATYEKNSPEGVDLELAEATEAARTAYDLDFEHPICAAGVARTAEGIDVAIENREAE
jgi:IMP cyclohydrolase